MQCKPLMVASLLLAAFAINVDTTIVNVARHDRRRRHARRLSA
jgi:hypothetical protein